ncbi:MAG: NAD(P)/FAD-dependent oxidoreductase, partial [Burkholderiaceae bacterium]
MQASELDVLIVGAGFAGVYMLHRARKLGLAALVVEAGADAGGTWYWNRYPGARCDIESLEYSYQFDETLQQEWQWSELYATQPEILRYVAHVVERFDLRRDMRFGTRVLAAAFNEAHARWTVTTSDGTQFSARFLVMATGCLSSANLPDIPGRSSFAGATFHTGQWPHTPVDFSGQRVAVVGTGSSAIQSIPLIARQAAGLWVFQRTASYSVPANNAPLDAAHEAAVKADYAAFRARNAQMLAAFGSRYPRNDASALAVDSEQREQEFERRWRIGGLNFMGSFNDLMLNAEANAHAADFVWRKIRGLVRDPATVELLTPRQLVGCKRLCVDSGYYETFNLPHVHLVDMSARGVEEITPEGLRANGLHFPVDSIVFATGFDAMTGALLKIDIRGRDGLRLHDKWHAGPLTYLGLGIHGFPNLFTISGPGSPSVLTNMLVSIEQHVGWIVDCLAWMQARQHVCIEAGADAERRWVAHVNA